MMCTGVQREQPQVVNTSLKSTLYVRMARGLYKSLQGTMCRTGNRIIMKQKMF